MVKNIKIIIVLALLVLAIGACKKIEQDSGKLGWTIVQSPLTDKCYELASAATGQAGFMGMSEVDCSLKE